MKSLPNKLIIPSSPKSLTFTFTNPMFVRAFEIAQSKFFDEGGRAFIFGIRNMDDIVSRFTITNARPIDFVYAPGEFNQSELDAFDTALEIFNALKIGEYQFTDIGEMPDSL